MKRLALSTLILTLVPAAAVARGIPSTPPAADRNGLVTIKQAAADARKLAPQVTSGRAFQVVNCKHVGQPRVRCTIRLRFTDSDGFPVVKRWYTLSVDTGKVRWTGWVG